MAVQPASGFAIGALVCFAGAVGTFVSPVRVYPMWLGIVVPLAIAVPPLLTGKRLDVLALCAIAGAAVLLNAGRAGAHAVVPIVLATAGVALASAAWTRRAEPGYSAELIRASLWVAIAVTVLSAPYCFMNE